MMTSLYTPFDSFVFRTPLLSFSSIDELQEKSSDIFQEAIFLASPEFFDGNNSSNTKKRDKVELTLTKYYQRARTRCTPFGLFAGCSIGKLGDQTQIDLVPINQHHRCTRLDMQYLCALIQQIEQMPDVRSQLLYFPNDSLYKIGGKYRYIEYRYQKTQRLHEVISVEIDEFLENVLSIAANGATIHELSQGLVCDDITQYEAEEYLNDIIDSQIIKSDIDPSVVGGDVLEALIDKLSKLKSIKILEPLQQIHSLLRCVDSKPVGSTLSIYSQIVELVKKIGVEYEAKYLFQVDMFKPTITAKVSRVTTNRLSKLIRFLSKITAPRDNPALTDFIKAFQKRYEEREIPLAEVLDGELGIGYPLGSGENGDISPLIKELKLPIQQGDFVQVSQSPLDRILLNKYIECTKKSGDTVVLSDEDLKDFAFEHQLSDTISVMCSIINSTQLYVSSLGGSSGANTLARFCHIDSKIEEFVREITHFEQESNSDVLYAEISHLPESRIGNIASRPSFREYTLHYLSNCSHTQSDIPISDLMISIRKGRLYLRSKRYNKEVLPRLTCAHNYTLSPIPVYRFLADMQFQGKTSGLRCWWSGQIAEMDYLPRIEYNDIILARQQWRVNPSEVAGFEKLSNEALIDKIKTLMVSRRVPQHVIVPDGDNELYIDLYNSKCLRLLLSFISKRRGVILEEFLFDPNNAIVSQDGNKYTNEMIFVFHK